MCGAPVSSATPSHLRPGSTALVVSLEEISQQLYMGNKRSMLLQNTVREGGGTLTFYLVGPAARTHTHTHAPPHSRSPPSHRHIPHASSLSQLFRCGGAAVVLSNKPMHGFRAKYKLLHTVRMQDTSAAATHAVFQCEDERGERGIELSRDLVVVAGKTLRDNLTVLGPRVLPVREQARVVLNVLHRRVVAAVNKWADSMKVARLPGSAADSGRWARPPVYVPDFKAAVQHFCIHAGGRAVIDGIEETLKLAPEDTAASRATLRNFGNTSSSSIWYELKYVEAADVGFQLAKAREASAGAGVAAGGAAAPPLAVPRPLHKGDRVLQIAFGSGFKCNSAVWLRLANA